MHCDYQRERDWFTKKQKDVDTVKESCTYMYVLVKTNEEEIANEVSLSIR